MSGRSDRRAKRKALRVIEDVMNIVMVYSNSIKRNKRSPRDQGCDQRWARNGITRNEREWERVLVVVFGNGRNRDVVF